MSLTDVTIEQMVHNRLPYLSAADNNVISIFKCEVYYELGVIMGIPVATIEDDSLYGGLQRSLIADIVSCYMLFTRSIETLTGINGKISNVSFAGSGLNDVTFSGIYTGTTAGTLSLCIDAAGTPDSFKWNINGGADTTGVVITAGGQLLIEGIIVNFSATTGHTVGDIWIINLVPGVAVTGKVVTRAKAGSAEVEFEQLEGGGTGANSATSIKMDTKDLLNNLKKSAYRKARNLGFIVDICEECSIVVQGFNQVGSPPFIISKC